MSLLKNNQHFVVWATHPDHPNYGGTARARKLHLATNHRKGAKTLCNMLVVEGVERGSFAADREMCKSCEAVAKTIIKKRFHETTYSFTINTDASFYPDNGGIAAWACWIKSSHYLIKESGLFPDGTAPNSSVAEVLAVEQALLMLDRLIAEEPFLQDQKILVFFNTDSLFTVQALNGNVRKVRYRDTIERVRAMANRYQINPRHVKGHSRGEDARSWVNNWCDRESRKLASQRKRELNGQATTKI